MSDRNEFAKLLNSTSFSNMESPDVVLSKLQPLSSWIKENIPNRLFRFRTCNEYSLSALEKDQIWGSSISTFNDPYECMPSYDCKLIQSQIQQSITPENMNNWINYLKSDKAHPIIEQSLPSEQAELFNTFLGSIDTAQLGTIYTSLLQVMQSIFMPDSSQVLNSKFYPAFLSLEYSRQIACFTEDYTSTLMWGHYANSHKGFCIEYDFKSALKECQRNCHSIHCCSHFLLYNTPAPVIYQKERMDASGFFQSTIMSELFQKVNIPFKMMYNEDFFEVVKAVLTKSEDWAYEKEWRLISEYSNSYEEHHILARLQPTAIYIGSKTSIDDAEKLYNICCQKNIPCYKMIQHFSGKDFALTPMLYEEYRNIIAKNTADQKI